MFVSTMIVLQSALCEHGTKSLIWSIEKNRSLGIGCSECKVSMNIPADSWKATIVLEDGEEDEYEDDEDIEEDEDDQEIIMPGYEELDNVRYPKKFYPNGPPEVIKVQVNDS